MNVQENGWRKARTSNKQIYQVRPRANLHFWNFCHCRNFTSEHKALLRMSDIKQFDDLFISALTINRITFLLLSHTPGSSKLHFHWRLILGGKTIHCWAPVRNRGIYSFARLIHIVSINQRLYVLFASSTTNDCRNSGTRSPWVNMPTKSARHLCRKYGMRISINSIIAHTLHDWK
jgi:hypothetical protein